MENGSMKVICEKTVAGVTAVRNITTPAIGNQGAFVRSVVGVGNPYWAWPATPPGTLIGADFSGAPICSADINQNLADIAAITAAPEDVLFFA